jgi:hypothetical protein
VWFLLVVADGAATYKTWTAEDAARRATVIILLAARALVRGHEPGTEDLLATLSGLSVIATVVVPRLLLLNHLDRTNPPCLERFAPGSRARAWLTIVAVALVGHGLLLVSDVRLQDDWWRLARLREGDIEYHFVTHGPSGNQGFFDIYSWFFALIGAPWVALRIVGFLVIVVTTPLAAPQEDRVARPPWHMSTRHGIKGTFAGSGLDSA